MVVAAVFALLAPALKVDSFDEDAAENIDYYTDLVHVLTDDSAFG